MTIKVPYVDLAAQSRSIRTEVLAAIEKVLDHGGYVLGKEVEEFESAFAQYCGTRFAVGVNSGFDAIFLSLRALGVGPGDEVITAGNSFIASAAAIALTGATPVLVDVRDDYNIDPAEVKRALTAKTRAILPVHLTGLPADIDALSAIADDQRIPIIEDAAQAVGARYGGRRVGGLGFAGCFSLHPLKNLHAYGDGGMISTNNEKFYETLKMLRNHGLKNREECEFWGFNSRLDTLQAAALLVKLRHLEVWTEKRRAIAAEYNAGLKDVVKVPYDGPNTRAVFQTYVIQAERRDALLTHLRNRGVDAKVHYAIPIFRQKAAEQLRTTLPVTERLSARICSLPLFPELTQPQIDTVISGVRSFYC